MPRRQDNATTYKGVLVRFMSYLDGTNYAKDFDFGQDRLAQLMPSDVERWMNVQAYGVPEPAPDANPTCAWSNSTMEETTIKQEHQQTQGLQLPAV